MLVAVEGVTHGLYLFVFEGNGGNSSTNLERVMNRITNRMVLRLDHTLRASGKIK